MVQIAQDGAQVDAELLGQLLGLERLALVELEHDERQAVDEPVVFASTRGWTGVAAPPLVPTDLAGAVFLAGTPLTVGVFFAAGADAAFFAAACLDVAGLVVPFFAGAFLAATLFGVGFLAATRVTAFFLAGAFTSPRDCRRTLKPSALACSSIGS